MFLGTYGIDEYVSIPAVTHRFSSGAAYAPSAITYSIYEEGGTTGTDENVDMMPASPFDGVTGLYLARRQLTAVAGFEAGKTYMVVVKATVDSVAAIDVHLFQIRSIQSGDAYARLGAPAGASVSADVAAIKTVADTIQADTDLLDDVSGGLADIHTDVAAVKSDTAAILTDTGTTLDGKIDAIKAKTDNLPTDPADQSAVEAAITAAHSTTNSKIDTVDDFLDTEVAAILADTNELQTDLANGGRLDLLIDGIKGKTDKLTYTSGNDLDVNVQKINDTTLTGNGSSGAPWGPA